MDRSISLDEALEIVVGKIAEITREYSVEQDEKKADKLKEKLDLLESFKLEVYKGNTEIIKKILEENKKGVI